MEESKYLLWFKRKQILNSHIEQPFGARINNANSSWEKRGFVEDAARILDGCIWPSRSYSYILAATKASSSRPITISTQENCYHQPTMSPYSSSISWGHHHMGSSHSEPKGSAVKQVCLWDKFSVWTKVIN
ncbi:hypothetical protein V8G54_018312 [Vigna mungo]|uniref:Uncharacterized protein n=1 Tax=Vigna mungo TaxID=3915 RepID=A0AAQ3RUM1_VIGMU